MLRGISWELKGLLYLLLKTVIDVLDQKDMKS